MGLGMPVALWRPVSERLVAAGVRVEPVEHAGVGEAVDRPPRTSMADLAADVLAALDARGVGRCHLAGISMGGMVAQELLVRRPDRFLSASLVATAAAGRSVAAGLSSEALAALLFERDRAERLSRLLFPPAVRADPALRARAARMAASGAPPATFRAHLRAAWGHDCRNRLRTLRVPTLVVRPELDVLIAPACSDELAAAVPGARLASLAGAGHGLIAQEPDALADLLLRHAGAA